MALGFLMEKGLGVVLGEDGGRLEALVGELGAREGTAEHVRQTLFAMPGLMRAVDEALAARDTPREAQRLWLTVISYLVHDRDMMPASERHPILGLLDDAYLLHRVALALQNHLAEVDMMSVAGGAQLLAQLLPRGVVRRLDDRLTEARGASFDLGER